jgi:hypothetical protein
MTDKIKKRIQELVPQTQTNELNKYVLWADGEKNEWTMSGDFWEAVSPITLAVVLRAIAECQAENGEPIVVDAGGCFYDLRKQEDIGYLKKPLAQWNLAKDNYDDQTQATKEFIGKIIGV